jgi:hypothetical protein
MPDCGRESVPPRRCEDVSGHWGGGRCAELRRRVWEPSGRDAVPPGRLVSGRSARPVGRELRCGWNGPWMAPAGVGGAGVVRGADDTAELRTTVAFQQQGSNFSAMLSWPSRGWGTTRDWCVSTCVEGSVSVFGPAPKTISLNMFFFCAVGDVRAGVNRDMPSDPVTTERHRLLRYGHHGSSQATTAVIAESWCRSARCAAIEFC